ncbi:hypothetical protein QYB59_000434 [Clostridium perfringens]|nr:hypothetical protein [Clostridium perfringens]
MNLKKFFSFKIKPINKKLEKVSSSFSLIILIISLIVIFYCIKSNFLHSISYNSSKDIKNTIGEISAYIFGFSIAMFIVRRILKYIQPAKLQKEEDFLSNSKFLNPLVDKFRKLDLTYLKKILQYLAILLRQWHIPISILAFALILIHGYISLHFGIIKENLNFILGYYLGILALIDLVILVISGIFRAANKAKNLHKFLGISFIILMLLHIVII